MDNKAGGGVGSQVYGIVKRLVRVHIGGHTVSGRVVLSAILPQFLAWISRRQAYQPVRLENDHTQAGLAVQTPATQTKNKI